MLGFDEWLEKMYMIGYGDLTDEDYDIFYEEYIKWKMEWRENNNE